jgi:hypothetical protein
MNLKPNFWRVEPKDLKFLSEERFKFFCSSDLAIGLPL